MEGWKENFGQGGLCKEQFYKIPKRQIVSITTTCDTVFPAFIKSPYLLVSEMVMSVIRMYGDMTLTKDIVFVDSDKQVVRRYFLTLLNEVEGYINNLETVFKTVVLIQIPPFQRSFRLTSAPELYKVSLK